MAIIIDGTSGVTFPDSTTQASGSISGRLLRAPQAFTSGTSYTTPANCNRILVEMVGGGGGGGGGNGASGRGGGGGNSIFATALIAVSPSTAYTIAIGAAGAASTASTAGGAGGTTSIIIGGTTYSVSGGTGGGTSTSASGTAGSSGTATNMDNSLTGIAAESGAVSSRYGGVCLTPYSISGPTGGAPSGYGGGGQGGGASAGGSAGYQGVLRIWEYS